MIYHIKLTGKTPQVRFNGQASITQHLNVLLWPMFLKDPTPSMARFIAMHFLAAPDLNPTAADVDWAEIEPMIQPARIGETGWVKPGSMPEKQVINEGHKKPSYSLQWRGHGWVWVGSNPPTFKKGTYVIFTNPKTFFWGGGWGSG